MRQLGHGSNFWRWSRELDHPAQPSLENGHKQAWCSMRSPFDRCIPRRHATMTRRRGPKARRRKVLCFADIAPATPLGRRTGASYRCIVAQGGGSRQRLANRATTATRSDAGAQHSSGERRGVSPPCIGERRGVSPPCKVPLAGAGPAACLARASLPAFLPRLHSLAGRRGIVPLHAFVPVLRRRVARRLGAVRSPVFAPLWQADPLCATRVRHITFCLLASLGNGPLPDRPVCGPLSCTTFY